MNYCSKQKEKVIEELKSHIEVGLSEENYNISLEKHGENVLKEGKRDSLIKKFFMQFKDFMVIILLLAATISFFVSYLEGEPEIFDPLIILAIVVLNALLGLVQESRAEKALDALKKMTSPHALVVRNGIKEQVSVSTLVPGDIVFLETGDIVPADGRLIFTKNLKVSESQLTGESVSVEKDENALVEIHDSIGEKINMIFSGSSVTYGRGKFIVTSTGMKTEVGKIAHLVLNDESPTTPLQKRLEETGKILGLGALGICAFIFLLGIFRGNPPFQMFMTSVSLAVAAIPEGLPAIVTIMLAIGVQKMARENAVIRKLPVVETLGSATVICSDKTGTLTQNKMTVVEFGNKKGILKNGRSELKDKILEIGVLCNDCYINNDDIVGEATEKAIYTSGFAHDIDGEQLKIERPRVDEIPFDSKRKLMSTIHEMDNKYFVATKGAPDVLLDCCSFFYEDGNIRPLTANDKMEIAKVNMSMAKKALRVIGVAYKHMDLLPKKITPSHIEDSLIFVGLIGMIDPPRKEVKEAVKICKKAGIRPVMITGDHGITARAIGENIGIGTTTSKVMTGQMLKEIDVDELAKIIYKYSIFARVSPSDKMKIVRAFQKNGEIVAMTGDGVNDAPALKIADIGCAMGISGTEVAKSASVMVLADDNFNTIVNAVSLGRGIYSNIKKAVHFLLSSNIGEIITILVAILFGFPTPLLPIHLLWVNLVTDSLPAIALGLDPTEKDIMDRPPMKNERNLFTGGLLTQIIVEGMMIGMLSLIAFGIGFVLIGGLSIGRTMAFATLSISQLFHAFNMRSHRSIFTVNILSNPYLIGAFFMGIFLQMVVIMTPIHIIFDVIPLSLKEWSIVFLLSFMPILIVELEKLLNKEE